MKTLIWNHHKPLLLSIRPIDGFLIPERPLLPKPTSEIPIKFRNKGYRNMAYWINSILLNTVQSFTNIGGTDRGILQFRSNYSVTGGQIQTAPEPGYLGLAYGSSTSPHDVSRIDLYSRHSALSYAYGLVWSENLTNVTQVKTYMRYIFGAPSLTCGEAGLYIQLHTGDLFREHFMIARAIISPSIIKEYDTLYEEGWVIEFPANYTRILPNILGWCRFHPAVSPFAFKDTTGTTYRIRANQPSAGSPDVMIGSDNSAPSPDDYNLKSTIGSLSSQSQSVEIDTTLQECRIVRQGTYTPTSNVTLGEIGLFINIYDSGGTARKVMIARGIWETPITLLANTTYTIGIVLKLG